MSIDHATWQIRTFWIAAALCILFTIVITLMAFVFVYDEQLVNQLSCIGKAITPLAGLEQLWTFNALWNPFTAIIATALITLIWPLTRVITGIFALYRAISPQDVGMGGTLIALLCGLLCCGLLSTALCLFPYL